MKVKLTILFLFVCHWGFSQINMTGTESTIVLSNFKFKHPMTVTSVEELAIVKDRIAKGVEPQATAYKALITAANAQQYFLPNAPVTMQIDSGYTNGNLQQMRTWLGNESSAAYTSALAYTYSGDAKYATKAIQVMNAWASAGTTFTGGGRFLQLGAWFTPMLYAADLLNNYDGWSATDKAVFKKWWREQVLIHTYEALYKYRNNQKDAGMIGVMAAAMVLEDSGLLQECLNEFLSYFQTKASVTDHPKQWKIYNDYRGIYLIEDIDRNLGRSGLTYTYLAMTTAVQNMEMARYAGYNFWTAKTINGGSFQGVIEQLFKWSILGDAFPWYANPDNDKTYQRNCYEIANSNCLISTPMKDWLSKNRPLDGAQGDQFVTLNKADIFNYPITDIVETRTDHVNIFRQSDGILNIKLSTDNKVEAIIYNKLGMKLKQFSVTNGDNFVTLPLNDLYIVQLENKAFKIIL
jgi:Alginate lyase